MTFEQLVILSESSREAESGEVVMCYTTGKKIKTIDVMKPYFRMWVDENNFLHREDGPAYISLRGNGKVSIELWYRHGYVHREDRPAYISLHANGKVSSEMWFKHGRIHREDGPAYISYYRSGNIDTVVWYKNGMQHREDGPARIIYDEHGKKYMEEWFENDELVEDRPARVSFYGSGRIKKEQWVKDGESHKIDGPAIITYTDEDNPRINIEYYIHGKELSKEEFEAYVAGVDKDSLKDFDDLLGGFE